MFERYTERARRTIFFGRYETSQFGCSYIETEHLLLGLFREDKVCWPASSWRPMPRSKPSAVPLRSAATKTDGLRELKGEILGMENPPLEMDLRKIFD